MATTSPTQSYRSSRRQRSSTFSRQEVQNIARSIGRSVSLSGTYRLAVELGLNSPRKNRTRYEAFWNAVNWQLPDCAIARAWGVNRSNVRARRLRRRMPAPRWPWDTTDRNAEFRDALGREIAKARNFYGPRPDPAQRNGRR